MNAEIPTYEPPIIYMTYSTVMTVISTPINLLTLWMIIKILPDKVGPYRWHLAWYQFLATVMEGFLHGALPEFFLPALSGVPLGFLSFLGCQTLFGIGGLLVVSMILSTYQCLAYRHWLLLEKDSLLKVTPRNFLSIAIGHYVFFNSWVLFGIFAMPIETGQNQPYLPLIIQKYPSLAYLKTIPNICATYSAPLYPPYINISCVFIVISLILCLIFYLVPTAILTLWHSYSILESNSSRMSKKTRRMHERYIRTLILAIVVPLFSMGVPYVFYVYIGITGVMVPHVLNNIFASIHLLHTIASSVIIIISTKPYRALIRKTVWRIFQRDRVALLVVQPTQTNNFDARSVYF